MSTRPKLTPAQQRHRMEGLRVLARVIARHCLVHPELYPDPTGGSDGGIDGGTGGAGKDHAGVNVVSRTGGSADRKESAE